MFEARRECVQHTIELPLTVEQCLPLFTPRGKYWWVPAWNPRFVFPTDGEMMVGMMFMTGEGADETFWTVVDYDRQQHRARYSRITPDERALLVDVHCRALDPATTQVHVEYALVGLSEAGNDTIADFIPGYEAMIEQWRKLILSGMKPWVRFRARQVPST